jgi:hypothetical protein
MSRPLPPAAPAPPVDERLVEAVAIGAELPPSAARRWLEGSLRLNADTQRRALAIVWAPLGGVDGRRVVRRVESASEGNVARKAESR